MQRILQLADHFGVPCGVCINKCDIEPENSRKMSEHCRSINVPVLARIPFDPVFTDAMVSGVPVVKHSDGHISSALRDLWSLVKAQVHNGAKHLGSDNISSRDASR